MIRKVCNFLIVMILMVIIAVAGSILVLQLLGYEPMAILSGSMEPTYRLGGLIFIDTHVLPEDIQKGDSIAFHFGDDTVVTHRVLSIDSENKAYITRGDANNVEDAPISFDRLIGRAWFYIPLLGYILIDLGTFKGLAYGLILLAMLIGLFVTSTLLTPKDSAEESSTEDEIPEQTMQTPTLTLQVSVLSMQTDSLSRQVSTFVDQASAIADHASSIFDQASAIIGQASAIIEQASEIAAQATATFNQASSIIAQMSETKVQHPVERTIQKSQTDEEELLPGIQIFFSTEAEYGSE